MVAEPRRTDIYHALNTLSLRILMHMRHGNYYCTWKRITARGQVLLSGVLHHPSETCHTRSRISTHAALNHTHHHRVSLSLSLSTRLTMKREIPHSRQGCATCLRISRTHRGLMIVERATNATRRVVAPKYTEVHFQKFRNFLRCRELCKEFRKN